MKTRTIRQTVRFKSAPHEVYEILVDSRKHSRLAGAKSTISRKIGGMIRISDGYITGENVELVKDKKIVQLWRAEEDCWPEDHFSTVKFLLSKEGRNTKLSFTQTGVPVECGDRFDSGWRDYYWKPMKEMLEASSRKARCR